MLYRPYHESIVAYSTALVSAQRLLIKLANKQTSSNDLSGRVDIHPSSYSGLPLYSVKAAIYCRDSRYLPVCLPCNFQLRKLVQMD